MSSTQNFKGVDLDSVLTNYVHKCSQEKVDVDQDEHEALHGGEHGHGGEDAGAGCGHLCHVPHCDGGPACQVTPGRGRGQTSRLVTPASPAPPAGDHQVSAPTKTRTKVLFEKLKRIVKFPLISPASLNSVQLNSSQR